MANPVLEGLVEYELMVILPPDMTELQLNERVGEFAQFIALQGGKVLHQEVTPLRPLAYRIKKHDRGYYATFHFSCPTEKVKDFERTVRIEMGVVRHLLIACPKHYEFKGIMEYEKEAEDIKLREMEERKADDAAKEEARSVRRRAEKPEAPRAGDALPVRESAHEPAAPVRERTPEKRVEAAKPVVPAAAEPVVPSAQEQQAKLDDVDEQLKRILENPDITV